MAPTARKSIVDSTDFGLLPQVDPQNLSLPDLERGPVKELVSISGRGDAEEVERIWRNLTRLPGGEYWLNNPSSLTNALLAAIKGRRMENIRLLLQKGIPPNWQHAEAANTLKDTSILELLLQHGWDINETPSWYQPPLLANTVQDRDLVLFYLSHGADPNAKPLFDNTALSHAVCYASMSTIKLLFEHGASVDVGEPLHWAVCRGLPDTLDVLDFLLQRGARINKIMYEESPESYACEVYSALGTPLHGAVRLGKLDVARFLVEHGANPRIEDSMGGTALQVARKAGHADLVSYLAPVAANSPVPEHQFTRLWRMPGWERFYERDPDPRL